MCPPFCVLELEVDELEGAELDGAGLDCWPAMEAVASARPNNRNERPFLGWFIG
jgi:hypothetical protein